VAGAADATTDFSARERARYKHLFVTKGSFTYGFFATGVREFSEDDSSLAIGESCLQLSIVMPIVRLVRHTRRCGSSASLIAQGGKVYLRSPRQRSEPTVLSKKSRWYLRRTGSICGIYSHIVQVSAASGVVPPTVVFHVGVLPLNYPHRSNWSLFPHCCWDPESCYPRGNG